MIRAVLVRGLLVLGGLVVGAGLGEITLRLYGPLPFSVDGDRIRLRTHATSIIENRGNPRLDPRIVHRKNSLGFRGEDPPGDFDRRLTIVAVGGSTTECALLSDGDDWPARLGETLRQPFPGVWVNNAGLDGHSTFGHRVLVEDHLAALGPDVVLFLVGANDVGRGAANSFDDRLRPRPGDRPAPGPVVRLARHSRLVSLGLNLHRRSRAHEWGLEHVTLDLDSVRRMEPAADPADAVLEGHAEPARAFGERVRRLVALAESHGMVPVLVTQPALYGDGTDPRTGVDLSAVVVRGRSGRAAWAVLEAYNDQTRRVAAEEDAPLIDLARAMPKDSRFFYDWLHFTPEGALRVAGIVSRELCPALSLRFGEEMEGACPS